jgi:hypothetical protein
VSGKEGADGNLVGQNSPLRFLLIGHSGQGYDSKRHAFEEVFELTNRRLTWSLFKNVLFLFLVPFGFLLCYRQYETTGCVRVEGYSLCGNEAEFTILSTLVLSSVFFVYYMLRAILIVSNPKKRQEYRERLAELATGSARRVVVRSDGKKVGKCALGVTARTSKDCQATLRDTPKGRE